MIPTFKFALSKNLPDYFLPTKAYTTDTGWDVRATQEYTIFPNEYAKIDLGFRVFAPEGWWLELRPRSSTFARKQLNCLYGVIDNTYEGNVMLAAQYKPYIHYSSMGININGEYGEMLTHKEEMQTPLIIKTGEAIGQIIPIKLQQMNVEGISNEEFEQLCQTRAGSRKAGGFGSSDGK
jgi:dUTPase